MKSIVLHTEPISVNRMYRGRRFLSKDGKAIKDAYAWEIRSQLKIDPIEAKIRADVTFYFKNPRMDIDNALKGLLDCMTGIAYKDDSQILELHVYKKIDKLNPRIEICIQELKEVV